jgi:hypothetical protein
MTNIFNIFTILFVSLCIQNEELLYTKQGIPSTNGIEQYVKNYQEEIIKEYEYRIDSLYDVYIFTENLSESENDNDLGVFYLPDYIVITNQEDYIDYEFKYLSKYKQRTSNYTERTVKAVIFHELTHVYINQIILIRHNQNKYVSLEYGMIRMFPVPGHQFGSDFIEEGICEYVVFHLNECSPLKNVPVPESATDLIDQRNIVNNLYYCSVVYLKDFLDKEGLKNGIEKLISNRPPTYDEILNPETYFNRLN